MSAKAGKKLRQSLLSFFVTPKPAPGSSGDDEKQVELPSTSGRGRKKRTLAPSDTSPSLAKKPKNLKTEEAGSAHEDTEVSSSSESCHTKLQSGHVSANSSLDAFFKVAPASSPKAEVTSSTEDEVIVIDEESRHSSDKQADCSMSADAVSGDNAEPIQSVKKRKQDRDKVSDKRNEEKRLKLEQKNEEKLKKAKEIEEKKRIKAEKKEAERLAKQKEKEAERLARQKEREEKQRLKAVMLAKKQAEIDAKNAEKEAEKKKREEEKRLKEEEKHKKEEEKREKEEERLRLEQAKMKKQEAQKNAFRNFFEQAPKKQSDQPEEGAACCSRFKPFQLNPETKLAPLTRRPPIQVAEFDCAFSAQTSPATPYLTAIKTKARSSANTWPWAEEDDDIKILGTHHRAKLLQFHTDVRPAYFGTWRKESVAVRARRPLGLDKELFDYEVDSADEWEEEEPGESVDSGDEEEEEKDEFDFDPELREDGFLVDHNYLSDDEGDSSDGDDSLAACKTKQLIARTYGKQRKKKNKLKPVVYGIYVEEAEPVGDAMQYSMLTQFAAIVLGSLPITFTAPAIRLSPDKPDGSSSSRKAVQSLSEEAMVQLIKVTHGCVRNSTFIVKSFLEAWNSVSPTEVITKRLVQTTIRSIANYCKKPSRPRSCWHVDEKVLEKYGLSHLLVYNAGSAQTVSPAISQSDKASSTDSPDQKKPQDSASTPLSKNQKRLTDFIQSADVPTSSPSAGASAVLPGRAADQLPIISPLLGRTADQLLVASPPPPAKRRVQLITLSNSVAEHSEPAVAANPSTAVIGQSAGGGTSVRSVNPPTAVIGQSAGSTREENSLSQKAPRRIALITLESPDQPKKERRRIALTMLSEISQNTSGSPSIKPQKGGEVPSL